MYELSFLPGESAINTNVVWLMAILYSTSRNSTVKKGGEMTWDGYAPAVVCLKTVLLTKDGRPNRKCVEKIPSWPDDALRFPPTRPVVVY